MPQCRRVTNWYGPPLLLRQLSCQFVSTCFAHLILSVSALSLVHVCLFSFSGGQVDVRPNPVRAAQLAEIAIARNK